MHKTRPLLRYVEGTEGAQAGVAPVATPASTEAPEAGQEPAQGKDAGTTEDPKQETFGRAYVEKLRDDAANSRIKAREAIAAAEKAQAERTNLFDNFQKLFGSGEEKSPEELVAEANKRAEESAAETEKLRAENRANKIAETFRDAADGVANAKILLPYLKGEGALDALDPTATDYASQVEQLINATVEAHPAFAVKSVSKTSGNAPTPSQSSTGETYTRDDYNQMMANREYDKINDLFSKNKFNFK